MGNKTYHILVVDDDLYLTGMLKEILDTEGYAVTVVMDGKNALDACAQSQPDLVLLDIKLADLDGFEVLRKIREKSNIPVIMLTGVQDVESLAQSMQIGADDYIRKPFLIRELLARIKAKLRFVYGYRPDPPQ